MAPTALPYCLQAQNETHGFPNRECLYWDENLVLCDTPPTHLLLPASSCLARRLPLEDPSAHPPCSSLGGGWGVVWWAPAIHKWRPQRWCVAPLFQGTVVRTGAAASDLVPDARA